MKNIFAKIAALTALIIGINSCGDNFLDRFPSTPTTGDYFKNEATIKLGLTGVYNTLYLWESGSNMGWSSGVGMGYAVPGYIAYDYFTGLCYEREENVTIGAGGGLRADADMVLNFWKSWYFVIARANTLIAGSDPGISEAVAQYIAEARVIRALAYYYLIATYGDVPLFTAPINYDQYLSSRTSKVTVLDFILNELDECAEILPSWIANERGRVDKSVAYGIKARAALLGGSLDYDGKGKEYFKIAADAAANVIGKRKLAANFDDLFTSYGQTKDDVRNEMILELMFSKSGDGKTHLIAFGNVSRFYGQTLRHPSQRIVDTYECIDGKRIDESPLYDPRNPKKNRDPRLNSTIWMHGDTVIGNTGTDQGKIKVVLNAYQGNPGDPMFQKTSKYNYQNDSWEIVPNLDFTDISAWTSFANRGVGYMWRKFSNDTIESVSASTVHFPILRYAEVLLTYAEAKIELGELDNSVYDAINQVRNRSKMPNVSDDRKGDVDKMRQLVRRERKVELILEGLHFVDMKRWKIGDLENDGPSYGMPTEDAGGYEGLQPNEIPNFKKTNRYDLNDIASYDAYKDKLKVRDINRFWKDYFYLWPIPREEINVDYNLEQNPEYN